jgi:hypothetical protein
MPAIFAFICVCVIYIFVVMLTPTIESPDAHFGIAIMDPEEDMLLWARLGCAPAKNMLIAKTNPEVMLFKFVLLGALQLREARKRSAYL